MKLARRSALAVAAATAVALASPQEKAQRQPLHQPTQGASVVATPQGPRTSWGDYDGDALADLYLADPRGGDRLLRNLGPGGLLDVTEQAGLAGGPGSRAALWADFDRDGRADLYLLRKGGSGRLLRSRPDGTFEDVTQWAGLAHAGEELEAAWADFDRDGLPDLWIRTAEAIWLYRNRDGASFEGSEVEVSRAPAARAARLAPSSSAAARSDPLPGDEGRGLLGGAGERPSHELAGRGSRTTDFPTPRGPGAGAKNAALGGGPRITAVPTGPSSPIGALATCSDSIVDQASFPTCVQASSIPTLGMLYPLGPELSIDPAGNVGIGTTTPASRLEVEGPGGIAGGLRLTNPGLLQPSIDLFPGLASPDAGLLTFGDGTGWKFHIARGSDGGSTRFVTVQDDGSVGIGTTTPGNTLDVIGGAAFQGNHVYVRNATAPAGAQTWGAVVSTSNGQFNLGQASDVPPSGGTLSTAPFVIQPGAPSNSLFVDNLGRVGLGTAVPASTLHVIGTTTTEVLTITGGSDLAEPFEIAGAALEPGTVVSIDPEHPGKLRPSSRSYDTAVAGVLSGAGGVRPGMTMSQAGALEGTHAVALAGRVYCRCDASFGAIRPGDLLTSSPTPGCAMKAADRSRAAGAILGKALGPLEEGRGLVLIVVALQ